jgi:hypothetical protein
VEWFKLSAKFTRDPKIIALSPKARWAYLHSLCEIADHESDGLYRPEGKPNTISRELVTAGLWVPAAGGEYRVPVWTKWNPTKAQLDAKRNASSNAARKRWAQPRQPDSHSQSDAEVDREVDVENPPSASAEGKRGRTENQALASVLLDADGRAQDLVRKLVEWDPAWAKATTNGALIGLGKVYGADVVLTALGFMREEFPNAIGAPYPYLESVCVRIQAERGAA